MSKPKTSVPKFEVANIERQLISAMKRDVDSLAKQFVGCESKSLEAFANLFLAKEFSTIFLGRLSISELIEFVENLLLHCVRYIVADENESNMKGCVLSPEDDYPSFVTTRQQTNRAYELIRMKLRNQKRTIPERIFGIYMCYCLYFLQPPNYVTPIRVSVPQMNEINRFAHDVLLVEEHMESLFCLFRLVDGGAFTITPFEIDYNPLLHRRFDTHEEEGELSGDFSEIEMAENFPLLSQLSNDVTIKQLSSIHDAYCKMKEECNLPGIKGLGVNESMNMANLVAKLLAETKAAYAEECSQMAEGSGSREGGGEGSARVRRSRIRQNAYSATTTTSHVQSRRRGGRHPNVNVAPGPIGQPPMLPAGLTHAQVPPTIRVFRPKVVKTELAQDVEEGGGQPNPSTSSKEETPAATVRRLFKMETMPPKSTS